MASKAVAAPADVYHMGSHTLSVSRRSLHGKTRGKLLDVMRSKAPGEKQGVIVLKGGSNRHVYDTDGEPVFRQESYFHYLFGVGEPDWFGALDIQTGLSYLFMPHFPESHAVWLGPILSARDYRSKYAVDAVHYVEDMVSVLESLHPSCLHVMEGKNSDSGETYSPAEFNEMSKFSTETELLFHALQECRTVKLDEEIEVMQYANELGSKAHVQMMQSCKPGMMEYQLESSFLYYCYMNGGARKAAYTPIAASGPNGAILHYGHEGCPNSRQIQEDDFVLCDMGCKYYGYDCDITTTFPANGKFNDMQKMVYETVLRALEAVKGSMKPGVSWLDMHKLAERTILEGLKDGGLLTGSVDEMLEKSIGAVFMPHGLGHFLGLDTHDVGGYPKDGPIRPTEPGRRSLRTARTLKEGMVITVEPGCYFIAPLIDAAVINPDTATFFEQSALRDFEGFGGVRLEDNVVVTSDGVSCMTSVPRTVDDVERVMAGGKWP